MFSHQKPMLHIKCLHVIQAYLDVGVTYCVNTLVCRHIRKYHLAILNVSLPFPLKKSLTVIHSSRSSHSLSLTCPCSRFIKIGYQSDWMIFFLFMVMYTSF